MALSQVVPQVQRRLRNPQHSFNVKHAPYVVQPFLIAPVLPGETLKGLSIQSRGITNPLKTALVGSWLEHYFFYVKHRDIDWYMGQTQLEEMAIGGGSLSGSYLAGAASTDYYVSGANQPAFVDLCLRAIMFTWFRDAGDDYNATTIDSLPAAYLNHTTAFQNAILETAMDTAVDVSIPVDATPTPDTVSVRDVITAMEQYQYLQQANLVNITYEDWLRSYGVRVSQAPENRPELIRYMREWSYPSTFVAPDTTTAGDSDVTSAVSWSVTGRADKARFFREPGFIVGLTCMRPKTYMQNQKGALVQLLSSAKTWLPAVLLDEANASWTKVTDAAADVLGGTATGDWWIDVKDLFIYGDQFVNVDLSTVADINKMAVPTAALNDRYPVQASVDALFVSGDATGGVRQDGVVRLHIESVLRDTSPRGAYVTRPI